MDKKWKDAIKLPEPATATALVKAVSVANSRAKYWEDRFRGEKRTSSNLRAQMKRMNDE